MALFSGGFWTGFAVGCAVAGPLVWYCKTELMKFFLGAEALAARLRAAADKLRK